MRHTFLFLLFAWQAAWAGSNALLSRGKTVYSSLGTVNYLTDNKFAASSWSISNNSWLSVNIGTGHSSVFFTWNSPNYTWSDVIAKEHSCKINQSTPVNYTIQKSSNSTNGSDGQWTTVMTVTDNNVTARGHLIELAGASWVKMNISTGGGSLDEVEVFDMDATSTDTWFFTGTSISANTYKAMPPAENFADLVTKTHPNYTPAMIRGGIPCILSSDMVKDLSLYLANAGNVKYWAIEMGTNDAWGGGTGNLASFKTNMQAIITTCKSAGIQPMIARMIATNKTLATWQVHPDFLTAIDDLSTQNNLIAGPDLYTYFLQHPNELTTDGVHPNAEGAASIQRLWAEKMNSLFTVTSLGTKEPVENASLFANPSNGQFDVSAHPELKGATFELYDQKGHLAFTHLITERDTNLVTGLAKGIYVLRISGKRIYSQKIVLQ